MSLFYKNKPQQNANPSSENESVVRPYKNQQHSMFPQSKKIEPKAQQQPQPPQVVDPTFPQRNQNALKNEQEGLRKSILLANAEGEKQSWLTKCCSCANLESYKKFFQVTNADVMKRILMNLQFWSTGFFTPGEEYDFYGPFWIYTTVVFVLSAVPNILLYQGSQNFQYNFEIVGLAFGFVYILGFLFPIILTFILKLLGVECTYIQNICIFGYSMCAPIICALLCSINSCILHILLLGYAFATKAWFITSNMLSSYAIPIPKKALIMGLVVGEAVLWFFVVKLFFINCVEEKPSTTTQGQGHLMDRFFHARSFQY